MARPDQGRQVRHRVPLLLATLAVVMAATAVYLTRPASAADGLSAYGRSQPPTQQLMPPADQRAAPPVLQPEQPKPLPQGAAPAPSPPPKKDDSWKPEKRDWP